MADDAGAAVSVPPWPPPPPWPPEGPPWPPHGPPWPPGQPQPKPINVGLVILGIVLGTVLWGAILLAMLAFSSIGSGNSAVSDQVIFIGGSLLVAGLSIAAIAFPKTRQFGAGLMLGIAVGAIAWAGLCALIIGTM